MKKNILLLQVLFISLITWSANKDSVNYYSLPDSVKAISFMAEIIVNDYARKKFCAAGIKTDAVILSLEKYPIGSVISFRAIATQTKPVANGLNVSPPDRKFPYLQFHYDWKKGETYKLLISQATDSAGNFSLYSGYVFLPHENKWKLIGTVKIEGRWNSLQSPATFFAGRKKQTISVTTNQVWCQRQNGSWKNMKDDPAISPIVNLYSHTDSIQQAANEIKLIEQAIADKKTDAIQNKDGLYYRLLKEGTGRQVQVTDTIVAFYKGYLFPDGIVFDQTKDKPATFPLKRLIKGWQIGVPLCKVGGKIKLVIPSGLAYSIRTRAAKIPPNSILVFEIEVVDAKECK